MALQNISRSTLHVTGRIAGAIVLSALIGANGFAQSSDLEDDENFKDFYDHTVQDDNWEIGVGFTTQDEGDLNKIDGDLSINRTYLRLRYLWPEEGPSDIALGFREEHSNYDFDGVNPLGLAVPFREVKRSLLYTNYTYADRDGSWILNGALTLGREQGVSPSEGLYGEANIGKLWGTGDVEVGIGVYMYSKLEDSAVFLPYPVVNWQITDDIRLGLVDSSSPGYGLRFDLGRRWDAYLIGNYTVRQYRLKDRTALSGGAVVDEDINGRAGVQWTGDTLKFELFGGLSRHKLSIDASNGLAGRDVADLAPVFGASVSVIL